MSDAAILSNIAVSQSGEVDSLLIEKFTGKVHEEYIKGENLMQYFDVDEVTGTNMVSNKYLGDVSLQAMQAGEDVAATPVEADKNALVIDAQVIARNAVSQLHDVQGDIAGLKSKLARKQTKQIKKMEDEMLIQQMILGARSNNTTSRSAAPRVSGHGFSQEVFISTAQAASSNSMLAAIELCIENMQIAEMDIDEIKVLVSHVTMGVLRDSERVVSKTFAGVGANMVDGFMLPSLGVRVIPSNRFPTAATATSILSKASNDNRYNTVAGDNAVVAICFTEDALLVGRSIALSGDIFFDKKSKSYFIDSWIAEGAIPDRWEAVGTITTEGNSTNADVTARTARKAKQTTTV
jgi:hypothetical protein